MTTPFPFNNATQQFAPQAPAPQQYAPQAPAPQYQPQAPAYAPQQAPQQAWGFQPQAPAPAQPLPQGDLSAFFGQPKTGRAPAVSWKGVPDGTTLAGIVKSDVTDADVVADTDPQTKALKTWRDGSPRYVLIVTLITQGGEVSLYCRGDLWDKLNAAMTAAGRQGAPKAGDSLSVTLVERQPGRGTVPKNIFSVQYATGDAGKKTDPVQHVEAPAPTPQAAPQPLPEAPAPVQHVEAPAPVQHVEAPAPAPQAAPEPLPQAPAQQAPAAAGLSAEQAALLAKLQGGQA